MMTIAEIAPAERDRLKSCISHYAENKEKFVRLANSLRDDLLSNSVLKACVHSSRVRVKEPDHLEDKLCRSISKGVPSITAEDLFARIDDLAGVRLLHLHTEQIEQIHPAILATLDEHQYRLIQAFASVWDEENKAYYANLNIPVNPRESMYTSLHYIVESNSKTKIRCELQVRTLMEEVWGEVSHAIDYPHPTGIPACKRQIKVLARIVSSGTRLVDSIFASKREFDASGEGGRGFVATPPDLARP